MNKGWLQYCGSLMIWSLVPMSLLFSVLIRNYTVYRYQLGASCVCMQSLKACVASRVSSVLFC